MAESIYSHQEVYVETVFEDTKNVCIFSRVQLKDYNPTQHDLEKDQDKEAEKLACDEAYVNDDECSSVNDEDSYELKNEVYQDYEPEIPFEGEFENDVELMKSMGLPVNFGNKKRHKRQKRYKDDFEYNEEYDQNYPNNENENCDAEWYEYWKLHGDTILMNAWVQKYKVYINPDYFNNGTNTDQMCTDQPDDYNVNDISHANVGMTLEDCEVNSDVSGCEEQTNPELMFSTESKDHSIFTEYDFKDIIVNKSEYDNMFACKIPHEDVDDLSSTVPCSNDGWDELWEQHNKELYDYHYGLFKDSFEKSNSIERGHSEECESLLSCSNCKKPDCYLCSSVDIGECALQFEELNINPVEGLSDFNPIVPSAPIDISNNAESEAPQKNPNSLDSFYSLPAFDDSTNSESFSSVGEVLKSVKEAASEQMEDNKDEPPTEIPITIKRR